MTTKNPTRKTTYENTDTAANGTQLSMSTKEMRRIIISSFTGSMIEFYDFVLYATASSIVFAKVFFSDLPPGFGIFMSIATFTIGYLARPLGGVIFGHFGDTLGRKKMLVLTLILMGSASTLIGLLPTSAQIGTIAPVVLVVMRILQGVSVGGEWGGATLIALEHAPAKHRGIATGLTSAGGPVGAVLATLMLGLFAHLPEADFYSWGWRVPFLFSILLVSVGLIIRLKVQESPNITRMLDEQEKANRQKPKAPILRLIRGHWRQMLIALLAALAFTTCQGLMTVWGVSEAVAKGAEKTDVLNWKAVSAVVTVLIGLIAAKISDKLGRRRVMMFGCGLGIILALPIVNLIGTGEVWGFAVAIILGNGLVQGIVYGPAGAFVAELFPTDLRFSGASSSYQAASTIGAGFSPLIASGIVLTGATLWPVALFWALVLLASGIAVYVAVEGKDVDVHAPTEPITVQPGKN